MEMEELCKILAEKCIGFAMCMHVWKCTPIFLCASAFVVVIQYQSTDVEFEDILSHTYQSLCGEAECPHVLCFYLNMD